MNMEAVVLEAPNRVNIKTIPRPLPAPEEVLLKVKACGICGSDIRYFHGENPWSLHTLGVNQTSPPNMILGHEFSGEIVEVGKNVSRARKGERVGGLGL